MPLPIRSACRLVPVEVEEDEKGYTFLAEVPGFKKDEIKVSCMACQNAHPLLQWHQHWVMQEYRWGLLLSILCVLQMGLQSAFTWAWLKQSPYSDGWVCWLALVLPSPGPFFCNATPAITCCYRLAAAQLLTLPSSCTHTLSTTMSPCICTQITFDPETQLLTMTGEKKEEEKSEGGKEKEPRSFSRRYSSFTRAFRLPQVSSQTC